VHAITALSPTKRGPSARNLFTKERFAQVKQEIESKRGFKAALWDVNKRLGEEWSKLPESDKAMYKRQAAQEREKLAEAR
jgi:hypothetical protein